MTVDFSSRRLEGNGERRKGKIERGEKGEEPRACDKGREKVLLALACVASVGKRETGEKGKGVFSFSVFAPPPPPPPSFYACHAGYLLCLGRKFVTGYSEVFYVISPFLTLFMCSNFWRIRCFPDPTYTSRYFCSRSPCHLPFFLSARKARKAYGIQGGEKSGNEKSYVNAGQKCM